MKAGMLGLVGASGKQQEMQPLLDQLVMPALIDQEASIKAGRAVMARMESRAISKSNRCEVPPHELERHERTIAVQSGQEVLCQNMKKIRNK